MAYKTFRDTLKLLEQQNLLRTETRPVSPRFEAATLLRGENRAVFFSTLTGSMFPAAAHLFGTEELLCATLGINTFSPFSQTYAPFFENETFREAEETFRHCAPVSTSTAPCQDCIDMENSVDITTLPLFTGTPEDSAPAITFASVFTADPETGKLNIGIYRVRPFDRNTAGIHLLPTSQCGKHLEKARIRGLASIPCAVVIGAPPAVTFAAAASLPHGANELLFAGALMQASVPVTECITIPLSVPADAEFVLEGELSTVATRPEGVFMNHTGSCAPEANVPVFHITALTRRDDAIYHATATGKAPTESTQMKAFALRMTLPTLQKQFPWITDMVVPAEAGYATSITIVGTPDSAEEQQRAEEYLRNRYPRTAVHFSR